MVALSLGALSLGALSFGALSFGELPFVRLSFGGLSFGGLSENRFKYTPDKANNKIPNYIIEKNNNVFLKFSKNCFLKLKPSQGFTNIKQLFNHICNNNQVHNVKSSKHWYVKNFV